jgi:protein gp37
VSTKTNIEWTSATWNPTVGCSKISDGCKHCYAETMHRRLTAMGTTDKYAGPFTKVRAWPEALEIPLRWREPRLVFVDSMSDLFHDGIPDTYVVQVFNLMERAHWHTFQVLTKRAERLVDLAPRLRWPSNVWMGVTVESAAHVGAALGLRGARISRKNSSLNVEINDASFFIARLTGIVDGHIVSWLSDTVAVEVRPTGS